MRYSPLAAALAVAVTLGLGACGRDEAAAPAASEQPAAEPVAADVSADNPLLAPSPLPYQYPPFDRIRNEHFAPAFERGMAEQREEVAAIAANEEAPTFENTIVAMELAGETLGRVQRVFGNLSSAHTNPEIEAVRAEMAPKLAAHGDAIVLDEALFARINALFEQRETLGLDAESLRLLERYHRDFVRAGARLSEQDKDKLRALNAELAELQTRFSQNVLSEVNASAVLFDSAEELDGLGEAAIAAAASRASEAGHEGKYLIALQNTTGQPPNASLTNCASRQRIHEASIHRGIRGGEFDNREVVARMVKLRAERAQLLGYPNHAAFVLEVATAGSVDAVNDMLKRLAPPAVANARREAADIQAMIASEGHDFELAPWDWSFYSEKVRQQKYDFDGEALRPYFELNRVLEEGVFYSATRLFGITFKERTDLPVYQSDVRVWEVFEADGSPLGIFVGDFYARPSKRGGAWMNAYVQQNGLRETIAVVGNHLNIPKPPDGEPTLLTFDETNTLFHEFGHAVHGLFSNVRYPTFAGTSVPRDFVEYPSQVYEMWATWPEVLANYAKHHETGESIPQELLDKVQAAETFNQGFRTTEYLASSIIDQAFHQLGAGETPDDVMAFEQKTLAEWGMDFDPVPPRYRTAYFSHTFSGGYSAGYYSYIWSEVLDADSVAWFEESGGLTRENGDHFRATLLSRGGTREAMDLYRDFAGRDPKIETLLKRRGLLIDATP
ncbi:MAG TPA: M3 family metallopeptidase [Xanthomonadaceae bacterium]|nr:M3 family metallopeptidase [Xanthomonadaceae bacterium]